MPRTPAQNQQEAMGVVACIRFNLDATTAMLGHLINLVPTSETRNSITELNLRLNVLRNNLAVINDLMERQNVE